MGRNFPNLTFDHFLVLLILYGIALRIITFWTGEILWDGSLYATIGTSLTQKDFITSFTETIYGLSLTYPFYLASFYFLFGSSIVITKIAVIFLSILLIGVVFLLTYDLYGYRKALIVAAITALDLRLILSTKNGYAENMIVLFFIITIWAMLKGIKQNDHFIIIGCLFAGLTFLSKTLISPWFVMAGLIAIAYWRFIYIRWELIKNKNYIIGFIILLVIFSMRFILSLKSGYMTTGSSSIENILLNFNAFITILPLKFLWILLLIGMYFLFWVPELKGSFSKIKEEYNGFIWFIIISFSLMTIIITSIIPFTENFTLHDAIFRRDNLRYVVLIYVPIMWLVMKENNFDSVNSKINDSYLIGKKLVLFRILILSATASLFFKVDDMIAVYFLFGGISLSMKDPRKRLIMMLMVFLIMSSNAVTGNDRMEFIDAAEGLNHYVKDGDIIAIDRSDNPNLRISTHSIYPYLTNHKIYFSEYSNKTEASFILSQKDIDYQGYHLLKTYNYTYKPPVLQSSVNYLLRLGPKENQRLPIKLWKKI